MGKGGRPKLDEKDRRRVAARVYLSAADAEIIDHGAAAHDMSRSEYLRACGLATALATRLGVDALESALTVAMATQGAADA